MIDLTKANQVMSEIAEKNRYISEITLKDYELFEQYFKNESTHTYGNSWLYVTQGTYGIGEGGLGYKYYDGISLAVLVIYPRMNNPKELVLYCVRPLGGTVLDHLLDISKKVYKEYKILSYFKKLHKAQFDYLINKGLQDTSHYPWIVNSYAEDDTFPELIFDIQKTLKAARNQSRRKDIRHSFLNAQKLGRKYKVEVHSENFKEDAWLITKKFFSKANETEKRNISVIEDYYNMIFRNPDNERMLKKVMYVNNTPLGFYIVEKALDHELCYNGYALIGLRYKMNYISDYMMFNIYNSIDTKYFNAGGSEDRGIHYFKMKYNPIRQNQMYWATNF